MDFNVAHGNKISACGVSASDAADMPGVSAARSHSGYLCGRTVARPPRYLIRLQMANLNGIRDSTSLGKELCPAGVVATIRLRGYLPLSVHEV